MHLFKFLFFILLSTVYGTNGRICKTEITTSTRTKNGPGQSNSHHVKVKISARNNNEKPRSWSLQGFKDGGIFKDSVNREVKSNEKNLIRAAIAAPGIAIAAPDYNLLLPDVVYSGSGLPYKRPDGNNVRPRPTIPPKSHSNPTKIKYSKKPEPPNLEKKVTNKDETQTTAKQENKKINQKIVKLPPKIDLSSKAKDNSCSDSSGEKASSSGQTNYPGSQIFSSFIGGSIFRPGDLIGGLSTTNAGAADNFLGFGNPSQTFNPSKANSIVKLEDFLASLTPNSDIMSNKACPNCGGLENPGNFFGGGKNPFGLGPGGFGNINGYGKNPFDFIGNLGSPSASAGGDCGEGGSAQSFSDSKAGGSFDDSDGFEIFE